MSKSKRSASGAIPHHQRWQQKGLRKAVTRRAGVKELEARLLYGPPDGTDLDDVSSNNYVGPIKAVELEGECTKRWTHASMAGIPRLVLK